MEDSFKGQPNQTKTQDIITERHTQKPSDQKPKTMRQKIKENILRTHINTRTKPKDDQDSITTTSSIENLINQQLIETPTTTQSQRKETTSQEKETKNAKPNPKSQ